MEIHRRKFGPDPEHLTIGWDSRERGDISEFGANGFSLNDGIVLQLKNPSKTPRTHSDLEIQKLTKDSEWQTVFDQQVEDGFEGVTEEGYRDFKSLQMTLYRDSQHRGLGHWWGAFLNDQLVGSMGLFFDRTTGLGRFQQVHTVKAHRRQGVCSTLLSGIIENAFAHEGASELLIVTDIDSAPERLYRSAGFQHLCLQFGLSKIT